MDHREQALQDWLAATCFTTPFALTPMAGDASFRRYFRVQHETGSFVAMDAPPPRENCLPFVAIAQALAELGLCVPQIVASDVSSGFLLLTDFGDTLYLQALTAENAGALYGRALDALAVLQTCREVPAWPVPSFTADFMRQELQLFKEWFLQTHLGLQLTPEQESMLASFFHFLAEAAASQPQVFMHRDYHSANLMVLSDERVGILDFQDAFIGPVTYDLVSLLRDCYIDHPDVLVRQWALSYKARLPELALVSDADFLRSFDLMGLQRHLKALLTFARKYRRDGSANYLKHIPRTLNYIQAISALYPECAAFHLFLNKSIFSAIQKVGSVCAQ